tara:strand:+ start:318 stop:884 length:567 start_codon:yes stop_codon:yes gene_type:complete
MGNICYSRDNWINNNYNSTNNFSLEGKYIRCRLVDIYDGDTCTCILYVFNNYYKFNIRLADIDTCEISSKIYNVKELGYKARMFLFKRVTNLDEDLYISRKEMRNKLNKKVYLLNILCGEFDKYGRLLGWLFNKDILYKCSKELLLLKSLNTELLNERLAYKYNGKSKLTELEQLELLKVNNELNIMN